MTLIVLFDVLFELEIRCHKVLYEYVTPFCIFIPNYDHPAANHSTISS